MDAAMEEPSKPDKSPCCQECNQNESKYNCPGCSIRTCSLPCVKSHKQRTNCNGKRNRTEFVPLSKFDDNLLISDYNLLEETKRVAESAERIIKGFGGNYRFKMPFKLRMLRNAAGRRKTRLLLLPGGMSRREKNQSIYDQRKKSIMWTVEWHFNSVNIVLIDHGVDENISLYSVIENHLTAGPWKHHLSQFSSVPLAQLKFFVRKNPKGPKSLFRELDINAPLCRQLADIILIEYPTIHVYLPSQNYRFEVEKAAVLKEGPTKPLDDLTSTKVVHFKEEEIEEDVTLGTQVFDLLEYGDSKCVGNYQLPDTLHLNKGDQKETTRWKLGDKLQVPITVETDGCFGSSTKIGSSGNIDFEFAQDLRDAYSGLIEQLNPDDFLCIEDGFVGNEELEEGEILEF
ncbi:hypothetical protein H6P81_015352 [Aristolochia fimbriata]|uniref:Box C/D snoRNA protein 1 n=1 Tax=Aristolochia fimbriata TaxID=158543 RepID=A0AAV7E928_ARIFI|nr:hypothetical protein H6P81_015352 [Aristolochia fimbriata]